jgi:hypothetical protein
MQCLDKVEASLVQLDSCELERSRNLSLSANEALIIEIQRACNAAIPLNVAREHALNALMHNHTNLEPGILFTFVRVFFDAPLAQLYLQSCSFLYRSLARAKIENSKSSTSLASRYHYNCLFIYFI